MRILVALLVVVGCSKRASHDVIADFRIVERSCLARFNDLLRRQKANLIDELELADAIDRQVLDPWRELQVRANAASVPEADHELYATLRRYLEERAIAWRAFSAALRSNGDEAEKPHYAMYHQQDAAAAEDARALGAAFRKMALVPLDPLVPDGSVGFEHPSPAPPGLPE